MKVSLRTLLAAVLAIFLVYAQASCGQSKGKSETEYGPAPKFELDKLSGGKLSLAGLKDRVVVLNFFGTWCPHCRTEIPDFCAIDRSYREKGVTMVGLALDTDRQKLNAFYKKYKMSYPVLLHTREMVAAYGKVKGTLGLRFIPVTFVINKAGNIYKVYVGPVKKETLEVDLKALL